MGRREAKREDLRERLIAAATARIAASGLAALRARDLADDAGCALGAIYTVFEDMDDLIIRVNSITLGRLGATAAAARAATPRERMKQLATTYADFAGQNPKLWAAVFEHRMSGGKPTPQWYLQEHAVLIEHIVKPLAALRPGLELRDLLIRAKTLFSAVHGIVVIALESRFVGIPSASLKVELERFIDVMVSGIEATPDL